MKLSDFTLVKPFMYQLLYKGNLVYYIEFEKNGKKYFHKCQTHEPVATMNTLLEILDSDKILDILTGAVPEKYFTVGNAEVYFNEHIEKFI